MLSRINPKFIVVKLFGTLEFGVEVQKKVYLPKFANDGLLSLLPDGKTDIPLLLSLETLLFRQYISVASLSLEPATFKPPKVFITSVHSCCDGTCQPCGQIFSGSVVSNLPEYNFPYTLLVSELL